MTIVGCTVLPGAERHVDEVKVCRVGVVSFRWRHHLLLVERSRARELWVGALVAEVAASAMVAQPVLARIPSTTVTVALDFLSCLPESVVLRVPLAELTSDWLRSVLSMLRSGNVGAGTGVGCAWAD